MDDLTVRFINAPPLRHYDRKQPTNDHLLNQPIVQTSYKFGVLHNKDTPAVKYLDGSREWWKWGRRHRIGGPAVELADGTKEWWENGQRHNVKDPAIIMADGTREWWFKNKRHRANAPAVICADGSMEWWEFGRRHCDNGPAIRTADGLQEWYVEGVNKRSKQMPPGPTVIDKKNMIMYFDDGSGLSRPMTNADYIHYYMCPQMVQSDR